MEITIYDIALVPLISGLIEVFKQVGLPNKYCALLSIILGIVLGVIYIEPIDIKKGSLIELMLGLSVSGLYNGSKSVQETIKNVRHDH